MNRIKQIPIWGTYALLAYMPFHVFLSQSLSTITGGLSAWKLAKDAAVIALAALCVFLVWRARAAQNGRYYLLVLITLLYALIHGSIFLIYRDTSLSTAALATDYNVRLFLLLIIGMSAATLVKGVEIKKILKFIIIVSSIVSLLGIIQYFLPNDFLTHFGYSEARGAKPSFLIDNKPNLPRIMSTLREPNSLGAFLIVPILLLSYRFLHEKRKLLIGGLLLLHGIALLLTFSRSAWLTLIISETVFAVAMYRKQTIGFIGRHKVWMAMLFVVLLIGLFLLRDQYFVQNTVFHSDENTIGQGSDDKHLSSVREGLIAIIKQPQGHGPATAGPVSMHTDKPFITENYYVQLGYEVGLLGLGIFIFMCVLIFLELKNIGTSEAKIFYAIFIGYAVCNLLLHTWANEAVATQWWLITGLIIGSQQQFVRKRSQQ